MNIKEWRKACYEDWFSVDHKYDYLSREIQKSLKYNPDPKATVRHHLRDTEEQRKYNDEHYELWGFEIDEDGNEHFEYGKYIVFVTKEEHLAIHALSEETRLKLSDSLHLFYSTDEGKLNAKLRMTDAVKSKISASVKATMTEEHRRMLSDIAKENMTDERKELIRQATKDAMNNTEIRKKISNSKLGKPLSEEHKKAISEGNKGRVVSKETREKISKIHKGKTVSDETKQKLRDANKKVWENDDYRKYQSDIHIGQIPWNKGVPMTEEQKEKLSAAKKGKPRHFSDEHKKKIIDSINKRTAAYKAYKELHKDSDIKYNEFCKVVWPELKMKANGIEYRFLVSLDPSFTRTGICIIDLESKHIMFYTASHKIGEKQFENIVRAAQSITSQVQAIIKESCGNEYALISEAPLPMSSMSAALYSLDTLIFNSFECHIKHTYNPATLRSRIHGHKYDKKDSQNLAEKYIKILEKSGYIIKSEIGTKKKITHDNAEAFLYAHLYLHDNEHNDFQFDNSAEIAAYKQRMKQLKAQEKLLMKQ